MKVAAAEIQSKHKLHYGTAVIKYCVIRSRSRRTKTSELIVDKDKVVIRVPFDKPLSEIRGIIRDKSQWIFKKQLEYKKATPQITKPTFKEGSTLPYLGRNYPLRTLKERQAENSSIELVDGEFIIGIKSSKQSTTTTNTAEIKKLYEDSLIEKAKTIFKRRVEEYSKKLGVKVQRIVIKRLKNRWGSMTKEGSINLNANLLKAPEDVIDYIILHEICHLKIKEHSYHYWDHVRRYMPNYQEKIEWLKVSGNHLI